MADVANEKQGKSGAEQSTSTLTYADAVTQPAATQQPDTAGKGQHPGKPVFTIPVHKLITEDALRPDGLNDASRFAIEVGDLAQDLDRQTRGMPTHHFDDDSLVGSLQGIDDHAKNIASMLAKPQLTADDETAILHEFGQRLHTIQDFYAHSNYVELQLKSAPSLLPGDIPLMNWEQIRQGQTDPIRTGFYYYKNGIQNEGTEFFMSRSGVISHLENLGMKVANTDYLPTPEYRKLASFQDRINYTTDPRYSVLHKDINKDDAKTDEGKTVNPATGVNLHEYARDLAVRETQQQWQLFESMVRRTRKNDADMVLSQFKNMSFTGALGKERFSGDGLVTWAIMTGKKDYKPR